MRFEEILTNDDLLDALYDMRFDVCTPIQERSIPEILNGRDLLGVAQTGTGKTAAYLLPIIEKLINGDFPRDRINCVIMVPTRELALQIDRQLQGFSYYVPVGGMAIYGGTDGDAYTIQRNGLKAGADIIIATPGRLLSHINIGSVDLSEVSFFILDEADRMLDMGFFDDIMKIEGKLPKDRQTLLFSATMPDKIRQLANNILKKPVEIKLSVSKPADKIKQEAYICYENQKIPVLEKIFQNSSPERVIIFASSKQKVKELSKVLGNRGINVAEMHSDLEQNEREEVMLGFKAGRINVVVATDIISRGIDIDNIEIVINFDVPREAEDYVHRVGRTARADREGKAITLVSEREYGKFRIIEKFIGKKIDKIPLDSDLGKAPELKNLKDSVKNKRKNNKIRSSNGKNKEANNHPEEKKSVKKKRSHRYYTAKSKGDNKDLKKG